MPNKIDLTGQRFGRLLVFEEAERNEWCKVMWRCQCDCGIIKVISGCDLRSGRTKSCGCLGKERVSKANRIDITGQRFGRYLVLESAYSKNGRIYWKCLCDCGTMKIVSGKLLRNGTTKSCGCLMRERTSERCKINIINQRFGRLLVFEEAGRNKQNNVLWKCRCDCGAIKIVCGTELRRGKTKSCGCFKREKTSEINKGRTGENNPMFGKFGKAAPRYNPNLTDEERQIRREYLEYKEWRTAVYGRDSYTCQCCGKHCCKLNAHHLESYANNPELRTVLENGITLCEECHKNFHHRFGRGNNIREQFEEFLRAQKEICHKKEAPYEKRVGSRLQRRNNHN